MKLPGATRQQRHRLMDFSHQRRGVSAHSASEIAAVTRNFFHPLLVEDLSRFSVLSFLGHISCDVHFLFVLFCTTWWIGTSRTFYINKQCIPHQLTLSRSFSYILRPIYYKTQAQTVILLCVQALFVHLGIVMECLSLVSCVLPYCYCWSNSVLVTV